MKKLMLICMIYMMVFSNTGMIFAEEIKTPKVEAYGAILMDFETGRVLWEKDAYKPLAMASTTKIMTAIVALENADIGETVTVSQKAALAPPVKMQLSKNEKISLKALLYALMLQSSNDAAVAIAEHVGGSVENFCKMMTDKAISLGAKDTVFETPNGLDFGDHHSTAYDMAEITRYALKNEDFIYIINTHNITFSSDKRTYDIYNKNRLLNEYSGANGVKTGYTGKAGHCFVGAAKRDGMQLISVVLASGWGPKGKEQKWTDTKAILNYGFNNYKYEVLVEEGEPAGKIGVTRSKTGNIGAYFAEGLRMPVNENEKDNIRVNVDLPAELKAPVQMGEKLGSAEVYIKDKLCREIDLLSSSSADRFDLKTCTEEVLSAFAQMATHNETVIILPESDLWK